MPKRNSPKDEPIIVVKLQNGLAERQRLPLDHVLRVLEEVRQMVADAGRDVHREMGLDTAPSFGLEILAGGGGVLFRKGSVEAQIAVTSNVETGVLAARRVVDTIKALEKRRYVPEGEADRTIVRRLNRIARIQETDKTEMQLALKKPGTKKSTAAVFSEAAAATAASLQAPVFQMQDTTVTGKLYELRTDTADDEAGQGYWGELRRDNGETWRVQFPQEKKRDVAALFGEQVQIAGTAKYYRIATPKVIVKTIAVDTERDYESAFDELFGSDRKSFPEGFAEALRSMRGDGE